MQTLINFYHERPEAFIVIAACSLAMVGFIIYALIPAIQEVSQRIKRHFTNPFDILEKIQDWQRLGKEIRQFENVDDGLVAIVPFFDFLSLYHDRVGELTDLIDYLQQFDRRPGVKQLINELKTLKSYVCSTGRDDYGWNRTKPGEVVTEDKVFLGDIFGLFTHPVSFWRTREDEPKDAWKGGLWDGYSEVKGKNSYDVVSAQARRFMSINAPKIRESVENIFAAAQVA